MLVSLVHQILQASAERTPAAPAITFGEKTLSYHQLWRDTLAFSRALLKSGLNPADRVMVFLDKRPETVIALFATMAAGGIAVPANPALRPRQVAHILQDCNVRVLVTSPTRLASLLPILPGCPDLERIITVEEHGGEPGEAAIGDLPRQSWQQFIDAGGTGEIDQRRSIDADIAMILYTSGSTGPTKGVVLSHRNVVVGAQSVGTYLENGARDVILAALPLSFDAGFSQLTTAFQVGARAVLLNYFLPQDAVRVCAAEGVTGITAVPPLWAQLAHVEWPQAAARRMRYFANTGGPMPRALLARLRSLMPEARPFLMYGLTEAFRSTYLDPREIDRRPESIGKAIPNAEILVVRPDGSSCLPGEEGELVHRGSLVAMGYWNDPQRTAERFRPCPGRPSGLPMQEIAVWSGDIVRMDEDGFLYFAGRSDDLIKTSGYRVSPTEVEEVLYASPQVAESVALGVPHPTLGQAIVAVVVSIDRDHFDGEALTVYCNAELPRYMVPSAILLRDALPRTPNGKIDRRRLADELADRFAGVAE